MSESTSERLLDAALTSYLERGWQGASLAEIARRAGFTTGAIYGCFKGKNELFAAVVDRELSRMGLEVERRLDGVETPKERLQVMRQWFRERRQRAGMRIFYDLWHQAAEHPRLRKALWASYERATQEVADAIGRFAGPRTEAFGLSHKTLAVFAMALMEGLLLRQFLSQSEDSIDVVFDLLERFVLPFA
jgi:AcrR family transcriptional regulator